LLLLLIIIIIIDDDWWSMKSSYWYLICVCEKLLATNYCIPTKPSLIYLNLNTLYHPTFSPIILFPHSSAQATHIQLVVSYDLLYNYVRFFWAYCFCCLFYKDEKYFIVLISFIIIYKFIYLSVSSTTLPTILSKLSCNYYLISFVNLKNRNKNHNNHNSKRENNSMWCILWSCTVLTFG